ncbi:MAG: hypothetical protein RLZZ488_1775 [Pseudomonadota bacterium]
MGIKFLKSDNSWEAFYSKRHPVTRQPVSVRRKGIKTKTEALKVEKELVLLVDQRLHESVVPTWDRCVLEWKTFAADNGIGAATIDTYMKCLNAHTVPRWGRKLVDEITPDDVRSLVQDQSRDWSPSHRKNMLKYVRAVLTFAAEKQFISKIPVPRMKFNFVQVLKGGLTEAQAKALLQRARDLNFVWYPHWALALYTGMRSGELYALKWDCVDLEAQLIFVRRAWNNKDGFKAPKNWQERVVPISDNAIQYLRELKMRSEDDFVLPRLNEWDKGEQARALRTFLLGMGLPPMRFHDLRATWATILLTKGVEPIKVMTIGGWKDMKTMMYYVRAAGVDIAGVTSCLDFSTRSPSEAKVLNFPSAVVLA